MTRDEAIQAAKTRMESEIRKSVGAFQSRIGPLRWVVRNVSSKRRMPRVKTYLLKRRSLDIGEVTVFDWEDWSEVTAFTFIRGLRKVGIWNIRHFPTVEAEPKVPAMRAGAFGTSQKYKSFASEPGKRTSMNETARL